MDEEQQPLGLFAGFGIELEYMIVDRRTLDVRPIADELLKQVGGGYELEVELGDIAWSNELALHVVELKTNGPSPSLAGLEDRFQEHVGKVNALLKPLGAQLLPTAMHPWMDPERELKLWPHEANVIYQTFDRIFDCRGHGWANLQSMHINLPFADDKDFERLHAAIRLVLPLLPGLAASSPFVEGRRSPALDARLLAYQGNAAPVFAVSGRVIPERVYSKAVYEEELLESIYRSLAPMDPEGVLRHEWVNARGSIARFDRMALEIRLLDVQEHPAADLAVAALVSAVVRALVEERWAGCEQQKPWDERRLKALLDIGIEQADHALLEDADYLAMFGWEGAPIRMGDLWLKLYQELLVDEAVPSAWRNAFDTLFTHGTLARRIVQGAGDAPNIEGLRSVYAELATCLAEGRCFVP